MCLQQEKAGSIPQHSSPQHNCVYKLSGNDNNNDAKVAALRTKPCDIKYGIYCNNDKE